MRVQRFGRSLCLILEPRHACESDAADEEGEEEAAADSKGRWFDHWRTQDGHFFRFGRLSIVYGSRRWRDGKRGPQASGGDREAAL